MEWLKIGFGNPLALWGLLACSIPLLLNLLSRQRFRTVEWGAMKFLQKALEKNRRRLQFENWLLLLVRMAIIACFVLAFSEPYVQTQGGVFQKVLPLKTHHVVVLDNSYSMQKGEGARSLWEMAKEAAGQIIQSAEPGDTVTLFLLNESLEMISTPRVIDREGKNKKLLLSILEEAQVSFSGTDFSLLFPEVLSLLEKLENIPAVEEAAYVVRLHLLTDNQRLGWKKREEIKRYEKEWQKKGIYLEIHQLGGMRDNVGVVQFSLERRDCWMKIPFRFQVRVKNFGEQDVKQGVAEIQIFSAPLYFQKSGKEEGPKTRIAFTLLSGEEKQISFPPVSLEQAGFYIAKLTLRVISPKDSDTLGVDSVAYLAFYVRPPSSILLVDGEPGQIWETDFLRLALHPYLLEKEAYPSSYKPEVKTKLPEKLSSYDAVVLANVPSLTSFEAEVLKKFVEEGGGLVIFLGSRFESPKVCETYNQVLSRYGLLPAKIYWRKRETYANLVPRSYEHPIFRFFLHYKDRIAEPRFWKYADLKPLESSRVLAFFSDEENTPAIMELTLGKGKVVLFNTSADRDWTNLPVSQAYLILMEELFRYVIRTSKNVFNRQVGDLVPLSLDRGVELVVRTKEGESLSNPTVSRGEHLYLGEEVVREQGVYELLWRLGLKVQKRQYLALNVKKEEGDLEPISSVELEEILPKGQFEVKTKTGKVVVEEGKGAEVPRGKLWRYFLILALSLVFWELWLSYYFGSQRG